MASQGTKKVSQKRGTNKPNGSVMQKSNTIMGAGKVTVTRSCGGYMRFRTSEFLPVRFLKHLGGKAAKGLHVLSMRIRPSPKISSSYSSRGRSKPTVTPADSHRNAAIEDCIDFINSSASLHRSNSVSAA
ncbi:hypothetical protein F3Y22_tig00110956pilonHSYRG00036 [Hibiscus syriacus]|uniref:Josephin-like protein n=1 Tax=Hibiscus syriacus TaxID=106335 RepID=A0A6A2Z9W4_HIBSY|nr:hypothetical protein F3Y22_tig00110956pilonHSYRG00036 [Hibiscus syriacus]